MTTLELLNELEETQQRFFIRVINNDDGHSLAFIKDCELDIGFKIVSITDMIKVSLYDDRQPGHGLDGLPWWSISTKYFINGYFRIELAEDTKYSSNKDRIKCFKCGCATENRRDFLTFEVREFCPRCKI